MKAKLTIGILSIAMFAVSGCAAKAHHPEALPSADFDEQFLYSTLDHLMHDIKIAKACPGKNIHAELQSFCAELLADQAKESDQMTAWLQNWYGKKPSFDSLPLWLESQNGEVFERYFLSGVLDGHRQLAREAEYCTTHARHPELITMCREVAADRTKEADRMERWNCAWFNKCKNE